MVQAEGCTKSNVLRFEHSEVEDARKIRKIARTARAVEIKGLSRTSRSNSPAKPGHDPFLVEFMSIYDVILKTGAEKPFLIMNRPVYMARMGGAWLYYATNREWIISDNKLNMLNATPTGYLTIRSDAITADQITGVWQVGMQGSWVAEERIKAVNASFEIEAQWEVNHAVSTLIAQEAGQRALSLLVAGLQQQPRLNGLYTPVNKGKFLVNNRPVYARHGSPSWSDLVEMGLGRTADADRSTQPAPRASTLEFTANSPDLNSPDLNGTDGAWLYCTKTFRWYIGPLQCMLEGRASGWALAHSGGGSLADEITGPWFARPPSAGEAPVAGIGPLARDFEEQVHAGIAQPKLARECLPPLLDAMDESSAQLCNARTVQLWGKLSQTARALALALLIPMVPIDEHAKKTVEVLGKLRQTEQAKKTVERLSKLHQTELEAEHARQAKWEATESVIGGPTDIDAIIESVGPKSVLMQQGACGAGSVLAQQGACGVGYSSDEKGGNTSTGDGTFSNTNGTISAGDAVHSGAKSNVERLHAAATQGDAAFFKVPPPPKQPLSAPKVASPKPDPAPSILPDIIKPVMVTGLARADSHYALMSMYQPLTKEKRAIEQRQLELHKATLSARTQRNCNDSYCEMHAEEAAAARKMVNLTTAMANHMSTGWLAQGVESKLVHLMHGRPVYETFSEGTYLFYVIQTQQWVIGSREDMEEGAARGYLAITSTVAVASMLADSVHSWVMGPKAGRGQVAWEAAPLVHVRPCTTSAMYHWFRQQATEISLLRNQINRAEAALRENFLVRSKALEKTKSEAQDEADQKWFSLTFGPNSGFEHSDSCGSGIRQAAPRPRELVREGGMGEREKTGRSEAEVQAWHAPRLWAAEAAEHGTEVRARGKVHDDELVLLEDDIETQAEILSTLQYSLWGRLRRNSAACSRRIRTFFMAPGPIVMAYFAIAISCVVCCCCIWYLIFGAETEAETERLEKAQREKAQGKEKAQGSRAVRESKMAAKATKSAQEELAGVRRELEAEKQRVQRLRAEVEVTCTSAASAAAAEVHRMTKKAAKQAEKAQADAYSAAEMLKAEKQKVLDLSVSLASSKKLAMAVAAETVDRLEKHATKKEEKVQAEKEKTRVKELRSAVEAAMKEASAAAEAKAEVRWAHRMAAMTDAHKKELKSQSAAANAVIRQAARVVHREGAEAQGHQQMSRGSSGTGGRKGKQKTIPHLERRNSALPQEQQTKTKPSAPDKYLPPFSKGFGGFSSANYNAVSSLAFAIGDDGLCIGTRAIRQTAPTPGSLSGFHTQHTRSLGSDTFPSAHDGYSFGAACRKSKHEGYGDNQNINPQHRTNNDDDLDLDQLLNEGMGMRADPSGQWRSDPA
jgi:hypothetical protein